MKNSNYLISTFAFSMVASMSSVLMAQPHDNHGGKGKHHPPKESVEACKDKKADDACSFESPHGKMDGKCTAHHGKPLHCRPSNPPAHHGEDHGQEGNEEKPAAK